MTAEGVTKLLFTMTRAYPSYKPTEMEEIGKVWQCMLSQYSDKEVALALKAFVISDTKGFAPSPGQLIDLIHKKPDEMSELEAWGLVNRAIRNGNYGAEEEFAKLPEVIQAAVGSPGQIREWASMDIEDLQTVAQSNFLRSYRACAERARLVEKMPDNMKRLYQREQTSYTLPDKEQENRIDGVPMPEVLREKLKKIME